MTTSVKLLLATALAITLGLYCLCLAPHDAASFLTLGAVGLGAVLSPGSRPDHALQRRDMRGATNGGGWACNPLGRWACLDDETDPATNAGASGNPGGGGSPPAAAATTTTQGSGAPPGNGDPPAHPPRGMSAEAVQALAGPLLQQVRTQVQELVQPVAQAQQDLRQRLDDLSRPVTQASRLFGGAPGIRTGESPLTSRGYQLYRLIGFRQGSLPDDQAKVELDLHRRLYQQFVREGGMVLSGRNSILSPISGGMVADTTDDTALAVEISQMLRQGLAGADRGEALHLLQSLGVQGRQALSYLDDTGLAALLGPTQHGDMIDLLRNTSLFDRAGATNITLPPNGSLQFPRQTQGARAFFVGEKRNITKSEPATGFLTMRGRKLAALVQLPNELLRFATATLEAFVRNDIAIEVALEGDRHMLVGLGSTNAPKGLLHYDGIQTHVAGTVGGDGDTFEPEDPALMLAKLEEANHDPEDPSVRFAMRPQMWYEMMNLRDANSDDEGGAWLFQINRGAIQNGIAGALLGKQVVRSTNIPKDRAKGSATNLQAVLAGVFRHWLIGRVGVMEFATTSEAGDLFETDQSAVRAIMHMDAVPRYEDAFVLADNLALRN